MHEKKLHILGLNPGTKYTGFAVFCGTELRDWGIKTFKGRWSKTKMKMIIETLSGQIRQYDINILVIKKLHPARSSTHLQKLVAEIKNFCRGRRIRTISYSIQDLEASFSPDQRINKKILAEILVQEYPVLSREFTKDQANKNPYHTRLFEAVALATACNSNHQH